MSDVIGLDRRYPVTQITTGPSDGGVPSEAIRSPTRLRRVEIRDGSEGCVCGRGVDYGGVSVVLRYWSL